MAPYHSTFWELGHLRTHYGVTPINIMASAQPPNCEQFAAHVLISKHQPTSGNEKRVKQK